MQLEIFKAGTYRGKPYGKDFIDAVAKNYDPKNLHEAPAVIGHPKDNAPAYGWVREVKTVGDLLVCEMDDATLDKKFVEDVKSGKFKKRSASFYMDLDGKGPYLRHVGFLGAVPPEVKGLKDVQFKESGELLEIEMSENMYSTIGRLFRRLRDHFIDKEGLEEADRVLWDWDIKVLESGDGQVAYSEHEDDEPPAHKNKRKETEEMEEAKVREDERAKAQAEFSEKEKAKDKEIAELKGKEAERAKAARKKDIAEFCEQHKEKIIPAWKKRGIEQFLEQLDERGAGEHGEPVVMDFGEKKEKLSLRGWFESFLTDLPKVIDLRELGNRGVDAGGDDEREALIKSFREEAKKSGEPITYKEAAIQAAKARPELFQQQ